MSLFPMIQPQVVAPKELQLCKEVAWNYEENKPVFKNGSPVIVTGKEAVFVWAWKALNTPRFRHEVYTWDYGNEAESLIGQPISEEMKTSEAARYIKECLLTSPYISAVSNVRISFTGDVLKASCTITTIYGEADINV